MKTLILLLSVFTLSGCGQIGKINAKLTGYDKSCIDGVVYLQFASGATVAYNTDGTIKTCGSK